MSHIYIAVLLFMQYSFCDSSTTLQCLFYGDYCTWNSAKYYVGLKDFKTFDLLRFPYKEIHKEIQTQNLKTVTFHGGKEQTILIGTTSLKKLKNIKSIYLANFHIVIHKNSLQSNSLATLAFVNCLSPLQLALNIFDKLLNLVTLVIENCSLATFTWRFISKNKKLTELNLFDNKIKTFGLDWPVFTGLKSFSFRAVSYTHLTLPTIYSV